MSLRGFDPELERRLRELARERGISLNKAALMLMCEGAGLAEARSRSNVVGDSLDHLIGSWSAKQERALLDAIEPMEAIDEELWR